MRNQDYMQYAFIDLDAPPVVDRREFLRLFGTGIVVLISLQDFVFGQERRPGRRGGRTPQDFNAFLRIGADGTITCFTGKIEMGQGVRTSLAQMLAEEMDAPSESIRMIMGDTDLCPWDMGTFGSMTTRFFGPALRTAGAEARAVLMELAARRLEVPLDRLEAQGGAIFDRDDPKTRVGYGQLAKGERIQRIVDRAAVLKSAADFSIIGRDTAMTEAREKVTGKAVYAGDVRLPGMLYARVLRPPAHGATLVALDDAGLGTIPGARLVRDGDLVAVLHETQDGADAACAALDAEFEEPDPEVDDTTIFEHLLDVAPRPTDVSVEGAIAIGEENAAHIVEASYRHGYVAHAPMEMHTAVARFEGEKVTVWASTQTPFAARDAVADALNLAAGNVRIITPFVGGGFGGKGGNRQVVEAARIARRAGVPVHLEWTRAEEFFYDSFMPAAIVKIRSGATVNGELAFWDYAVYFAGTRGADLFYDAAHRNIVTHGRGWRAGPGTHPFATGAWRAPGENTNGFARESQIDMMAEAIGLAPYEFRMRNLKDARMRAVLQAAAERFGSLSGRRPAGRGVGISCAIDAGTYVAHVVEVAVERDSGRVRVERVVCAQDMGLVINPRGARKQMEGCITMGLGYALSEEIRFNGGAIHDTNFDSYRIPRFSWVPEIETVLVDTGITEPHGGGEPAIVGMGGAIANAIHDAVGARLFRMPMTPERVKAAMDGA